MSDDLNPIPGPTPRGPAASPEDAFEALRRADPAAGHEVDILALREALHRRLAADGDTSPSRRSSGSRAPLPADAPSPLSIAVPAPHPPADTPPSVIPVPDADAPDTPPSPDPAGPDDLTVRRAALRSSTHRRGAGGSGRRPARRVRVLAAAAAVVLVAVGGYAAGSAGLFATSSMDSSGASDDGGSADQAPAAGAEQFSGASDEPQSGLESGSSGSGSGSDEGLRAAVPKASADTRDGSADAGQETLTGSDLGSGVPTRGPVLFEDGGLATTTSRERAYGLDPTGATGRDRAASLATALGLDGEPTSVAGAWSVEPETGHGANMVLYPDATFTYLSAVEAQAPAPTSAEAIAAAKEFLGTLGVDASTYRFDLQASTPPDTVTVRADLVLGGRVSDVSWYVQVCSGGVISADGSLAKVVALGSYPTVSAARAVDRLNDPRFGPVGAQASQDTGSATRTPQATAGPQSPGSSFSWPVTRITITAAEPCLVTVVSAAGSASLVPAWTLTGADGASWQVLAVAETDLDMG